MIPDAMTLQRTPGRLPEVSGAELRTDGDELRRLVAVANSRGSEVEVNEIPPEMQMLRQVLVGDSDSEDEEVKNRSQQVLSALCAAPRGSVAEFLNAYQADSLADDTQDDHAAKKREELPVGSLERVGIDTWRYCGVTPKCKLDYKVLIRRITDPNKLTVLEEIYQADLVRELMPEDPLESGARFFAYLGDQTGGGLVELATPDPVVELDDTDGDAQEVERKPVVSGMIPKAKRKAKEGIVPQDSGEICSTLILQKEAWPCAVDLVFNLIAFAGVKQVIICGDGKHALQSLMSLVGDILKTSGSEMQESQNTAAAEQPETVSYTHLTLPTKRIV